jgi:hypothetical protein
MGQRRRRQFCNDLLAGDLTAFHFAPDTVVGGMGQLVEKHLRRMRGQNDSPEVALVVAIIPAGEGLIADRQAKVLGHIG